ncbi:MAG: hypothetical protein CMB64_04115 [Euryarchaeota archaeon]|nr:hypothetical protein [Euryarchaeota archaeon]
MKKWINKITGSLALIGVIIVLMGTQNKQSSNENWMIVVGAAENNQELILKMNTENGDVYRWDKKGLRRFEGKWVKLIEVR